jgi:hypothetical protein
LEGTNATQTNITDDVKEPTGLNELDEKGLGIQVASSYFL